MTLFGSGFRDAYKCGPVYNGPSKELTLAKLAVCFLFYELSSLSSSLCESMTFPGDSTSFVNVQLRVRAVFQVERLNQQFAGAFVFLCMPIALKNHCNIGFACINFREVAFGRQFAAMFHGVEMEVCSQGSTVGTRQCPSRTSSTAFGALLISCISADRL